MTKKHYLGTLEEYDAMKWNKIRCALGALSCRMGVNFTPTFTSNYIHIESKEKITLIEIEYIIGYFHGLCFGLDANLRNFQDVKKLK